MYSALKFLHLAAGMVWLGGMAFMLLALRPSLPVVESPAQRLTLLAAVLHRFFLLVWVAIALLLASGFYILGHAGAQAAPAGWHAMAGIGTLMCLIFGHLYFALYRPMRRAIDAADWPGAGRRAQMIARLVMANFVLGWLAVAAIVFLV